MSDDSEISKNKPKKQPTGDYPSGYCRPPNNGRWKKGQPSPNPRGRPPKSKRPDDIVDRVATSLIEVVDGGKSRKVSKYEALVIKMSTDALKGDHRAMAAFLRTRSKYLGLPTPPSDEPGYAQTVSSVEQDESAGARNARAYAKKRADEGRRAIFNRVALRKIPVRDNGILKTMPIEEALWHKLYADSLKGDAKAMALLVRYQDKIGVGGVEPRRDGADDVQFIEFSLSLGERSVIGDDTEPALSEFDYEE